MIHLLTFAGILLNAIIFVHYYDALWHYLQVLHARLLRTNADRRHVTQVCGHVIQVRGRVAQVRGHVARVCCQSAASVGCIVVLIIIKAEMCHLLCRSTV